MGSKDFCDHFKIISSKALLILKYNIFTKENIFHLACIHHKVHHLPFIKRAPYRKIPSIMPIMMLSKKDEKKNTQASKYIKQGKFL